MDITMIGLQNAGKTSLLRVLAVSSLPASKPSSPCYVADAQLTTSTRVASSLSSMFSFFFFLSYAAAMLGASEVTP